MAELREKTGPVGGLVAGTPNNDGVATELVETEVLLGRLKLNGAAAVVLVLVALLVKLNEKLAGEALGIVAGLLSDVEAGVLIVKDELGVTNDKGVDVTVVGAEVEGGRDFEIKEKLDGEAATVCV